MADGAGARIEITDPRDPGARYCLRSYAEEMTLPNGLFLVATIVGKAAARGITMLRLETNHTLAEARRLYETAGFTEVEAFSHEPYAHHWFERPLAL